MNIQTKLFGLTAIGIQLLTMVACVSDTYDQDLHTLTLAICDKGFDEDIKTRSITPIYNFKRNDQLSLYIVDHNTLNPYGNQVGVNNYMGTYTDENWQQSVRVNLIDTPGTVMAFYPYSIENSDPSAIPVKALEEDYLYGVSTDAISYASTNAEIRMKHIHSIVRFKFSSEEIRLISEINVSQMPEAGTFDLSTGKLTCSGTTIDKSYEDVALTVPSDDQYDFQAYILPGDNIRFNFIIDKKFYFYKPTVKLQPGTVYNIKLSI